ncbi:hypothetical protein [Leptolyngbya iicbica]
MLLLSMISRSADHLIVAAALRLNTPPPCISRAAAAKKPAQETHQNVVVWDATWQHFATALPSIKELP